jgi:hypothetical protein
VRDAGSVTGSETVRRHASDPVSGPVTGRTDACPSHRTFRARGLHPIRTTLGLVAANHAKTSTIGPSIEEPASSTGALTIWSARSSRRIGQCR